MVQRCRVHQCTFWRVYLVELPALLSGPMFPTNATKLGLGDRSCQEHGAVSGRSAPIQGIPQHMWPRLVGVAPRRILQSPDWHSTNLMARETAGCQLLS